MILVRNHRLLSSGSKFIAFIVFLSFLTGCSTLLKTGAPKSIPAPEKPIEPTAPKEEAKKPVEVSVNKIALLLPFQLDKIKGNEPTAADIKQSEMPLDFYQGFKLALDNLAKEGKNFQLNVIDTRDNIAETSSIGKSIAIKSADLIVGPIFPKEISAFASSAQLGNTLQVSPLAASAPSLFNIGNLVSLATPIGQHIEAIATYLKKKVRSQDKIIVYNTHDVESEKFLEPLLQKLKAENKGKLDIIEITNLADAESKMTREGKNYFIVGSINKFAVDAMLVKLVDLKHELDYSVQLIGHPNWTKMNLQHANLHELNTIITTSYYVDPTSSKVKDFQRRYLEEFQIEPSEFAYKGFDTGYFFGSLLVKYGPDYTKGLLKETYKGLQTSYTFDYNPKWGYVNTFIQILQFDGNQYQPIN